MFLSQLRTSKQLGWRNCAAVAAHRVAMRAGIYERQLPIGPCPCPELLNSQPEAEPFLADGWTATSRDRCIAAADALLAGTATGSAMRAICWSPPDWFLDPALPSAFRWRAALEPLPSFRGGH